MSTLFKRNIEFTLVALNQTTGAVISSAKFNKNRINVQLSKSFSKDVPNTGLVSITNIPIRDVTSFSSITEPFFIRYFLKAGYGDLENIPLISRGSVTETTWSHAGGDTNIEFYISEASKYLDNPYANVDRAIQLSSGNFAIRLIEKLEAQGQTFKYVPNKNTVFTDLRLIQSKNSQVVLHDVSQSLEDYLNQSGYTYFQNNAEIIIRKKAIPGTPIEFLINDKGVKVILNFKTGLLSADIENTYDYQKKVRLAWLKFNSLFIPEIFPLNRIEIDEPIYPHLAGEYIIYTASYALNNKDSDFKVSGRALHKDFINPITGLTTGQLFKGIIN